MLSAIPERTDCKKATTAGARSPRSFSLEPVRRVCDAGFLFFRRNQTNETNARRGCFLLANLNYHAPSVPKNERRAHKNNVPFFSPGKAFAYGNEYLRVQCGGSSEPSGQSRRPSQYLTDDTHRAEAAEKQANSDCEHAADVGCLVATAAATTTASMTAAAAMDDGRDGRGAMDEVAVRTRVSGRTTHVRVGYGRRRPRTFRGGGTSYRHAARLQGGPR